MSWVASHAPLAYLHLALAEVGGCKHFPGGQMQSIMGKCNTVSLWPQVCDVLAAPSSPCSHAEAAERAL